MIDEFLTPEEFARRLKIGRSTLFEWLRKNVLVAGVHYFKQGRIIRFIWSDAVVAAILESARQPAVREPVPAGRNAGRQKRNDTPVNWNY